MPTNPSTGGHNDMDTYAPQIIIATWFSTAALLTYSIAAWGKHS